jgi:hypothetical protein
MTSPAQLNPYYKSVYDSINDLRSNAEASRDQGKKDTAGVLAAIGIDCFNKNSPSFERGLRDRDIRLTASKSLEQPLAPDVEAELQEIRAQRDAISTYFFQIKALQAPLWAIVNAHTPQKRTQM